MSRSIEGRGSTSRVEAASPGRAALVIAHPGHELRVHGWLERTAPIVFILTDGGGHEGVSRLDSTTEILERVGATPRAPYGRYPDTNIYRALMDHRFDVFLGLIEELTGAFLHEQIDTVVGDAFEGYNPSHDVCRLLVNAVVAAVASRTGRTIANYDFPLVGSPDAPRDEADQADIRLELTDEEFSRKVEAARRYRAIDGEVKSATDAVGWDAFRVERLRRVPEQTLFPELAGPAMYERRGERRVAEGHYATVLRHRDHMVPLVDRVRQHIEGMRRCAG